jgi:hypothetical protein
VKPETLLPLRDCSACSQFCEERGVLFVRRESIGLQGNPQSFIIASFEVRVNMFPMILENKITFSTGAPVYCLNGIRGAGSVFYNCDQFFIFAAVFEVVRGNCCYSIANGKSGADMSMKMYCSIEIQVLTPDFLALILRISLALILRILA